jgi:tungstate transport system substrate-binding protein
MLEVAYLINTFRKILLVGSILMQKIIWCLLTFGLLLCLQRSISASNSFITLASTTSTQNSGLFKYILPMFKAYSGIDVRVVAVGTGQAIRLAKKGDADVLLVHHKPSELKFVRDGFGVSHKDVMYNDFVIIGPNADPAGIKGITDSIQALGKIQKTKSLFVSRGDDSGTNKKELGLWQLAGVDVKTESGSWYRETGSGMGATLNVAMGMQAYTLTDRGTWISFKNKNDLVLLAQGDKRLFNPYGVILISKVLHSHVKSVAGKAFIDWLTSSAGQRAIGSFLLDGKQLFFPNAK